MFATMRRRWGDNDKHLGPFTYAYDDKYRPFAMVLESGDDEYPGCSFRVSAFGVTIILGLPHGTLKPHSEWVDTSKYSWSKPGPDGRHGYTQIEPRAFGFSYHESYLQVFRGARTMDSGTDSTKGYFLPWGEWRHVRRSFYGLNGEHIATDFDRPGPGAPDRFQRQMELAETIPTASFEFDDFDGERITATTQMEEREWRFGAGRFKWLSWFRSPRISRSIDIRFSAETGRRKGSWKGGTIGHSIAVLPGELHEAAFRRYCKEHNMTFIGTAPAEPVER